MTTDAVGGVWQYSLDLAAGLAEHGFETLLAVLGPGPSAAQRCEAEAVPGMRLLATDLALDWVDADAAAAARAAEALVDLAGQETVDLVHLNSPSLAAYARFDVPVVAAAHGCPSTWWEAARTTPLHPGFEWHRHAMARGLSAATLTIAPTRAFAETIRRHYGLTALPQVVHNGRRPLTPAAASGTPGEAFAFTAGRLWDAVKRIDLLDDVAARLDIPFYAAGPLEAPQGDRIAPEHLRALGRLDSAGVAEWLARRPVFVSAASFEPFGLAVLEAAMAGCPLVLSDIAPFRELWDGAARFVAPGDGAAFAAAIEEAAGDAVLRERMGEQARARSACYSAAAMAVRTARVYEGLLRRKAAA